MKTFLIAGLTAPSGLQGPASFGELFTTVINVLLGVAGAVAVIFILIGAIQYATSAGNDSNVAKAKGTIVNAVIGLVIAIMALAIVNFVVTVL